MNQCRSVIEERQKKLLTLIREHGKIAIAEASEWLQVSEITVRRDLEILDKKYLVERYHGGARAKLAAPENDMVVQEKEIKFREEKNLIGKIAASLVPDNSTIFLGSGTTTLFVLKHLANKHITVVTNNAYAPTCTFGKHMEVILCGGECRPRTRSLIGPFAEHVINSIFADVAILGANGITVEHGVTTDIYHEARIYQNMVKQCKGKVILVADGNKIGKIFSFASSDIYSVHTLITDSSANAKIVEELRSCGIEVLLAD